MSDPCFNIISQEISEIVLFKMEIDCSYKHKYGLEAFILLKKILVVSC